MSDEYSPKFTLLESMIATRDAELDRLRRKLAEARAALNLIASWEEGPEVTGKFDEPGAARTAREALAKLGATKP